ncbi:MAG: acetate--CoA ligase family protein [Gemmatimonadaceae bacterium]|nr:acetate--CoA ligase family protein [Gemmatimonadaceae bacterium]
MTASGLDDEWTATVEGLTPLFRPRSVAVIGASRRRGTISAEVFHNLMRYEFNGAVYPVNPSAQEVQSVVAYPTVEDVPGAVDLAVLVVPAAAVLEVARGCARKGVKALVVISAGFAETGAAGRELQEALVRIVREGGMRLVGPNCMGMINTDPAVRLDATFAPSPPPAGRVAFMSQSGGLGLAIIDYAGMLGLGLSSFVSVGNKADVSSNDLLRFWEQDERTKVILLYLESFGNPRKFSRIARRVARVKPIVAVKSGRSAAGARATGSHTGALIAASDVTVDALFLQAGVIRTDTLAQMFDVASLLAHQPPPRGRRVAILTNAGGPGILCADACAAEGLEMAGLSEETRRALRVELSPSASVENPVDMIASATAGQYREAMRIVGSDSGVDSMIAIFVPPLVTSPDDVARAIVEAAQSLAGRIPVLTVFMQSRGTPAILRAGEVQLPSYAFPEDAAIALGRVASYGEWLRRPVAPPPRIEDVRAADAAAVLAGARARGATWLAPGEVAALLSAYGLPLAEQRVVETAEEAARSAEALGGALALKAIAPGLVHKTDAGMVRLDLEAGAVLAVAEEMNGRLRASGLAPGGFVVQRMSAPGVEMIVGVVHDPQFGPVVACGAGGVLVELLKDVSVRLTPLTALDAEEMVRALRTYPLLTGYRGGPAHDVAALVGTILRVGALVEAHPEIGELDLNPIIVHERGATIVDARVKIAAA